MIRLGLGIAVLVALGDQLSKWIVLERFDWSPAAGLNGLQGLRPITSFFDLVLTFNHGVSFGFFNNGASVNAWIFSILAAIIVVGLLFWLARAESRLIGVAIGCVIGGAIGNVVDRNRIGAVVDFLDFHIAGWHWPAFNVADSAICVGVAAILLDSFVRRSEPVVQKP